VAEGNQSNGVVVELDDVHKIYRSGEMEVHAVCGVSLKIQTGEFVALMGSSGSGKSTLMNIVGCLDRPTHGRYLLDGQDVSHLERDQLADYRNTKLGFVFQSFNLLPRTSARENVELPLLYGTRRLTNAELREKADEVLNSVGLTGREDHHPSQLSGGQQQRVGVARGLAVDPNILLMDEPFGAVDPIVRSDLQQETLRLQRELDKTIVFVTHDIDEAFLLGDLVVILEKGAAIAQQGSPEEILANPASEFVADFIGAERGKRRLTVNSSVTPVGDDLVLIDAGGYAAGVISAPGGQLAAGNASPKSRSISNKTSQAGDA
jgi:osmoprotectant transport system ATP-binding protein